MPELTIDQALQIAIDHHRAGRLADAESIYRRILTLAPRHAEALHLLGLIAHQSGDSTKAVQYIESAVAINDRNAEFHNNLGEAYRALRALDRAEAAYRTATTLAPHFAPAFNNLGLVLSELHRYSESESALRQAIKLNPRYASAYYNLAGTVYAMEKVDDAISLYHEAIRLDPQLAVAYVNLGAIFLLRKQPDAAIRLFRDLLVRQPDRSDALNNMGNALKDQGNLDEAIVYYRRGVATPPENSVIRSNLIYALHFHADSSAAEIHEEQRRWNGHHADPLRAGWRPHTNDRTPQRRLKIGYVSPDFYHQAECFFVVPLLEQHDHTQFEIHCFSSVPKPDEVTQRLRQAADLWHDVWTLENEALAEKIRAEQIDILVDLTMHMAKNRLPLFAARPAPVQVTWLAYPATTGLPAIDYRLTDAVMEPEGRDEPFSSEKPIRLPDSWCCYQPVGPAPEVNALPARRAGHITFGSFNNPCKLNDAVFAQWSQVLRALPDSQLLLLAPVGEARNRFRAMLANYGIKHERVEFVAPRPRAEYLQYYHRIDIALDPFPYNGITTTCDALWMGVPVVTVPGDHAAARAGASLLKAAGLDEFVADSARYVDVVTRLATDLDGLAALRSTLRNRVAASALMDGQRFAGAVETAYRTMWTDWCASGNGRS